MAICRQDSNEMQCYNIQHTKVENRYNMEYVTKHVTE